MYRYISFLILMNIVFGLSSSSVQAENLLEIYQLAQQHDPQLKIAHQERLVVLEKKPQARAPLLPQVTLNANVTENWQTDINLLNRNRDMENTTLGYTISLNYALYRRELNIQFQQVDSQIAQVEANYETARQALMERVSTRYFAILTANDNLKFARSAKKAFQRQLEEAQRRFEVGLIAITDVEEAQAGYDLAIADEILAQNELDTAYEVLREITDTDHFLLASLNKNTPLLNPNTNNIDAWTEVALEQNPNILAAQFVVATARQEIEKQRAANLPSLDLVGQQSFSDTLRGEDDGFNNMNFSIGIQLRYALYEGGAIQSRIRESQQRHVQALDKLEQQRRTVQLQTRQLFYTLLSNTSRVKALKQALVSTETALDSIQTGFELGTRTSVDVVNAQRDLLRVQRDYSKVRYDYVLNTLRLKQAAGVLSQEDLEGINYWLTQPTIELQKEKEKG